MSTVITSKNKTREVVLCGLLTALVFVSTRFLNVRLPISINGGLIHMGNTMLFVIALVFGKRRAAIAGAFGMGLFDLVSGWFAWAPFTFIIRGIMSYMVGSAAERKGKNSMWMIMAAIVLSGLVMIAGYYVTEALLYGNWIAPMTSIPGNVIQLVIGAAFGVPLAEALKRTKAIKFE